ncbi:TauD/TfdA family dioxygenase [Caballeronia sp. GAWG1-1]|uniref:TauD/TfdA family dioxygenase n=1 Tax=Caballeronia sp. GAWG1-1 TaxID=2921742 RepID=UPI0032EEAA09
MNFVERLEQDGFAVTDFACQGDELAGAVQEIAASLGEVVPGRTAAVELLEPTEMQDAHRHSLSALYGKGDFPWHMDTAHRTEPVRFVVMACAECSEATAPTVIAPWREQISSVLTKTEIASALFLVKNGRSSFYSGMWVRACNYLRYDPGCMAPVNEDAVIVLKKMRQWSPSTQHSVDWKMGRICVFDNWRMLHRRGSVDGSAPRTLLRCYSR